MIEIQVKGLLKTQKYLKKLQKEMEPQIPLKMISVLLQNKIKDFFEKGGNDEGPWKALKGGTPSGKKVLIKTGVLRASFEGVVRGNELTFGTSVKYSKFHQQYYEGTTFNSKNKIPRRPMLPSSQVVGQIAVRAYESYFKQILK